MTPRTVPTGTGATGARSPLPPDIGHDRTARRILEAAVVGFAARGVHGTSMRDVAAAAGIRAPSIYQYFSSKEQLVGELMQIGSAICIRTFDARMSLAGDDPLDQLDAAVEVLVELNTRYPALLRLVTDDVDGFDPTLSAPALAARMEMSVRVGQLLLGGEEAGVFSFPDLTATVAALHGLFIRLPHWFSPSGPNDVAELTEHYCALVRSMLNAPPIDAVGP